MSDKESNGSRISLRAQIEALLFIAPGPVTTRNLAEALETSIIVVESNIAELDADYSRLAKERGLRLQRHRGRVQLTTVPAAAPKIEKFLGLERRGTLTQASLETLAIIIYKQPVTRPQVDAIRGVNSDGVIKNLLSKGLIEDDGRADSPGRPIIYRTSSELLQYFGIDSIDQLPPFHLPDTILAEDLSQ